MLNRVQRYNKILEYANIRGGKGNFLEKYRMQSDFNGRNLRRIMPHNRHRDAGYYPAKWTKQMAKGRIFRGKTRAGDEGGAMRIMATRMSPKCKIKEAHMDVRA